MMFIFQLWRNSADAKEEVLAQVVSNQVSAVELSKH